MKANVVHTHHIGPLLYAGIAARLSGVKHLIHTEHDAWHLNNSRRCKLQRWAIRLTRPQLIADANSVAVSVKKKLRLNKKSMLFIMVSIPNILFQETRALPGNGLDYRKTYKLLVVVVAWKK